MLSPSFRRVGWSGIEQEARGDEECVSWSFRGEEEEEEEDFSRCNKGLVFEVRILGLL